MINEMSQLGYHLKQMADYGNDAAYHGHGAEIDLQHSYQHLDTISTTQQRHLDCSIQLSLSPMQYASRYLDAVRQVDGHHDQLSHDIDSACQKEAAVRKALDHAKSAPTPLSEEIECLADELETSSQQIASLKQEEHNFLKGFDHEVNHLQDVNRQSLDSSLRAFATKQFESCQAQLAILEAWQKSLVDAKSWRPEVSGVLVLEEFV
jgi:chromosome segregation ATPase